MHPMGLKPTTLPFIQLLWRRKCQLNYISLAIC